MSIFHQHKWQRVSTDYTPPVKKFEVDNISESLANKLLSGTTHIYMKCIKCGEIKQIDLVGKY